MIEFPIKNIDSAVEACEQNISPRKYWIHTKIGGPGWEIKLFVRPYVLKIEDDKIATFLKLKL